MKNVIALEIVLSEVCPRDHKKDSKLTMISDLSTDNAKIFHFTASPLWSS